MKVHFEDLYKKIEIEDNFSVEVCEQGEQGVAQTEVGNEKESLKRNKYGKGKKRGKIN